MLVDFFVQFLLLRIIWEWMLLVCWVFLFIFFSYGFYKGIDFFFYKIWYVQDLCYQIDFVCYRCYFYDVMSIFLIFNSQIDLF